MTTTLTFTKHHGAGNDFLVLVDRDDRHRLDAALVRALADRHRGIGADGVLRAAPAPEGVAADVAMELVNADGTPAEMSGNGVRCLVQAVIDAGLAAAPTVVVATAAGLRTVLMTPGPDPHSATGSVDMGPAAIGDDGPAGAVELPALRVSMGNPHLVLLDGDPSRLELSELGPRLQAEVPGGVNVELIAPGPEPGALTLRVWERGVGETLACGTGSCAAAAAARRWGIVGDDVLVHNPGGDLAVTLRPDGITLAGPTRTVGTVVVEPTALLADVPR